MTDTASASLPALGICLEEYEYPYPVRFLPLTNDLEPVAMAYMDIPPRAAPNGQTVVLMHGKAFGCYYFHNVIEALTGAGYRVSRVLRPSSTRRYGSRWRDVLVRVTLGPALPPVGPAPLRLTFQMIYQQPRPIRVPPDRTAGAADRGGRGPHRPARPVRPAGRSRPAGRLLRAVRCGRARHPRATRLVIPDCGHIPHLEHPGQFIAELLPFLAH